MVGRKMQTFEWKAGANDHDIHVRCRGRQLDLMQGGFFPDEPEMTIRSFDNVRGVTVFVGKTKEVVYVQDPWGLLDDSEIPEKGPRAESPRHVDFRNLPQIMIPRVIRLVVISTPEGQDEFEALPKLAHVFVDPNLKTTGEVMFPLENPETYAKLKEIIDMENK